jgi:hypothetical protein
MGVRQTCGAPGAYQALDSGGAPLPLEFLEAFNIPEKARAVPGGGSTDRV